MLSFFKKMFKKPSIEELATTPGSGVISDPDFGYISYVPPYKENDEGFWQMFHEWNHPESNAKVGCSAIPGDCNGPFQEARTFLLLKRIALNELWVLCNEGLIKEIEFWYKNEENKSPKEIYFISSLAMESSHGDEWEVSFESKSDYYWTFTSFQIKGNTIIGTTTDT